MTRRTLAPLLLAAGAALALTACAHASGTASSHRSPGTAGLGAVATDPYPDTTGTPTTTDTDQSTPKTNPTPSKSTGTGTGGGTGGGPKIVSFTATGAVCPVEAKPGAPYSQPGQVTVSWKISTSDGVALAMDGGLWSNYPGQQGSATLPFQCPDKTKPNTHTYTLTIKGHAGATKTISATAKPNP
jgi:hypothetical protein